MPADTLSPGTRKRISRIRRRAIAQVREAYENGQISARRADTLLYLEPAQQEQELGKILTAKTRAASRARQAVAILKIHLASGTRNLVKLQSDLRLALSCGAPS